jgi:ubiquinol-cytochrome c reductase cytochrome c1 subunit
MSTKAMPFVTLPSLFPTLRAVLAVLALVLSTAAQASGGAPALAGSANVDPSNVASLQRGARNFVNYCMGCHSAKYVRFNQLGKDLGIPEDQLIKNLMFAAVKPTETMEIAMQADDAQRWFGQAPPDLSLITRAKGNDYVYNFLRSFYVDSSRPLGSNNLMLPNASMPAVLWELQGTQKAVFRDEMHNGSSVKVFEKFESVQAGSMKPEEFDQFARDTVNFLAYIAEPMKLKRESLGVLVISFLLFFGILAYLLKQEIWKDVR